MRAIKNAQEFIGTTEPLDPLGWGVSGFVFVTPDVRTAVKVHHQPSAWFTEVKAYSILKQHRIVSLHGLTIPKLRAYDEARQLIQIDFVSAPFLLDFAGVTFEPPDFSPEVMADNVAAIHEKFGPNAHIAFDVYHSLAMLGIYYLDMRPSNLNLEGLPGVDTTSNEDDFP